MEKYVNLELVYLKRHYYPHLLLAAVFCLLSGGFMSFRNLEWKQAAQVMEMYVILTGIILFTPIFMPQQDVEIWSLERSKCMPMWKLYLQRIITAVFAELVIITVFVGILAAQSPAVKSGILWRGSICEAIFLGSIGYFFSAMSNQAVIGYMVSILFYAANIGLSERFGMFGLFGMMRGIAHSLIPMLCAGILLLFLGAAFRNRLAKR